MTNSTQLSLVLVDPRIPDSHIIDRFWSKVDRSGECWLWLAGKTDDGYGGWSYPLAGGLVTMRAHRFAFLITYGALNPDLVLHHTCETPLCVRPDHLIEMTQAAHMAITPGTYGHIWGAKTHCVRGHELSGDNLYQRGLERGARVCKACAALRNAEARDNHPEKLREAQRKYRERKRAERWAAHIADLEAKHGRTPPQANDDRA